MFKDWLKQFLAVILCAATLVCCLPTTVFADETPYKQDGGEDSFSYYIIEGKEVSKLFDFNIGTILGGRVIDWLFTFRSFTVIKEYNDGGSKEYKVYFNTPNLQSIVKNQVISAINDGYTDSTYDVNETEWMVEVGPDADKENAITKYGFAIPCYTYMGEYPKEIMTVAGIVPTNFWEGIWRSILSIFGVSFIDAPDTSNYNTIEYLNHEYNDDSDLLLDLFKKYYMKYFVNQISTENFSTPEELIAASITKEEDAAAKAYTDAHAEEYRIIKSKHDAWTTISAGTDHMVTSNQKILNTNMDRNYFELTSKFTPAGVSPITQIGDQTVEEWVMDTQAETGRGQKLVEYVRNNISAYSDVVYMMASAYYPDIDFFPLQERPKKKEETPAETTTNSYDDYYPYYDNHPDYDENEEDTEEEEEVEYFRDIDFSKLSDEDILKVWFGASAIDTSGAAGSITIKDDINSLNSSSLSTFLSSYGDPSYTTLDEDIEWEYKKQLEAEGKEDEYDPNTRPKYTLLSIYGSNPTLYYSNSKYSIDVSISLSDYINFLTGFSLFNHYTDFVILDFLTEDELLLFDLYNKKLAMQENYDKFVENFGKNEKAIDSTNSIIGYSQCLIESEESEKCESKAVDGKSPTSISVASLYAYSGLYKITKDVTSDKLTSSQAILVINKIKTYCGPYYDEVLANLITIMIKIAANHGDDSIISSIMRDDPRVMPFDISQLPEADRANYEVSDPRVEIYKSHIVGGLVSNFTINMGFGIFIKPQQLLVNLGGKLAELAVMFQQLCNFDKLDELGLSPTYMWQSAFITLLMSMLALFFIIKTVIAIVKMGTKSMGRLVVGFIVLVIELGIITAFALNPEQMWTNIKNAETAFISLGERTSAAANSPKTQYLFGDNTDGEVLYYLPYLDLWSKYNTGYGLHDDEQFMDSNRDKAELKGYDADSIKIGSSNVQHYSILLADAFSYYGDSISATNAIVINNTPYNGPTINNNAYRVVDHFMAPRINITSNGSDLTMDVVDNENYNGEFQGGFINLLSKFLNCALMCLLSIIKFFTFLWQWFLIYTLIFKIILGRGAENKSWGTILLETFAPTVALIFIGLYAGVILQFGMIVEGLLGIILEIFLFFITFMIIRWWKTLKQGMFFPKSLEWLYILTNLKHRTRHKHSEHLRQESEDNARNVGLEFSEDELDSLEKRTNKLFNEDGTFKSEYKNDRYNEVYKDWYKFVRNSKNTGKELTEQQIAAMNQFESDDRFKSYAASVKKFGTGKRLNRKLGISQPNNTNQLDNQSNNQSNTVNNDTLAARVNEKSSNSKPQSNDNIQQSNSDQFNWNKKNK